MAEENFKFPPGIRPATEWLGGSIPSTAEAIQRDAVTAARQEGTVFCSCTFSNMLRIRRHDGAKLCSFCDCELKERV